MDTFLYDNIGKNVINWKKKCTKLLRNYIFMG